jgi:glutamyl/glutaminyl-tRNA synthetase
VSFIFLDEIAYTGRAQEVLSAPTAGMVLEAFVEKLNSISGLDVAGASSLLQELRVNFEETEGLKAREVMFPIRASLTGTLEGPSLAAVMALLGKERCIERVRSSQGSFSS